MLAGVRRLFSKAHREEQLQERLQELRRHLPVPVFWLLGKTQSGKTSVIKFLTGADQAEIGRGFQPCTRFSRLYQFPIAEAPLVAFLDTRGLDEPGYDPAEDLARFGDQAHVVMVTAKVLDHAQEHLLSHLGTIRRARPGRPVVLVFTCLHEAYPQQQHPLPYPLGADAVPLPDSPALPPDLVRSIHEQRRRFADLADRVVAVDLTPPGEGFNDPNYGGPLLHQVLLDVLPGALRQTLLMLDETRGELQDLYARHALPHVLGYSTLAATAAAVPFPVVDLVLVAAIQSRMVYHLAEIYGQALTGRRFLEIAGTLGIGLFVRQGWRMLLKWIPFLGPVLGSVTGSAVAGASTFALGKAFCWYYRAIHEGHVPRPEDLRRYYKEQLTHAEQVWTRLAARPAEDGSR
jgi:uncharacterized protein (DUF697 family)